MKDKKETPADQRDVPDSDLAQWPGDKRLLPGKHKTGNKPGEDGEITDVPVVR